MIFLNEQMALVRFKKFGGGVILWTMFSQVLPTLNIFQTRYLIIIMYILIFDIL